jgi:TatD DNase family protein
MIELKFIDSHSHIHEPWFSLDKIYIIIRESLNNKVVKIISCASDPENYEFVLKSSEIKEIEITLGIQPTLADKIENGNGLREILNDHELAKNISAIGEIGLDYHWIKEGDLQAKQEKLFIDCINIANEYKLPVVIHSRKAETEVLDVLEKYASTPVLLHSFEGNLKEINRGLDLDYIISIPTNVTIRGNRRKVVKRAGLDNIILETDSPYCAPIENMFPNTPSSIPIAAEKIAQLLEIEVGEVARRTSELSSKFYNINY